MRIYGRGFTFTIVCLALTSGLTLLAWSGSANQGISPQEASRQEITPENDVPVLTSSRRKRLAPNN